MTKAKEPHETALKIKSNISYRAVSIFSVRLKREPNNWFKSLATLTGTG